MSTLHFTFAITVSFDNLKKNLLQLMNLNRKAISFQCYSYLTISQKFTAQSCECYFSKTSIKQTKNDSFNSGWLILLLYKY